MQNNYAVNQVLLNDVITKYIEQLPNTRPNELFKWKAVQHFQEFWDIDAENFSEMLENSLEKTESLLSANHFFALKMILLFSQKEPDFVRNMFKNLFDETKILLDRFIDFEENSKEILKQHFSELKNGYQNFTAISIYLWLRFPDKYYIYKSGIYKTIAINLFNIAELPKGTKKRYEELVDCMQMYGELNRLLQLNQELIKASNQYLTSDCYPDTNGTVLTVDFIFLFSQFMKEDFMLEAKVLNNKNNIEITSSEDKQLSQIPLNQILYGPPGTGKTYKIQQIAKKYIDADFNEEAYLGSIVKNISWLDVIIYAVLDIKKPCKLAEILKNRFYKAKLGNGRVNSAHIDQVLVTRAIRNPTNLDRNEDVYPRREPLIFDRNIDNEWFIVDSEKEKIEEHIVEYNSVISQINNPASLNGTESQNRYELVTFHQSFSYEDFVEGIRASTNDKDQIQYKIEDGVFKKICDEARKNPHKKFAIFIDEINRGNIANIFGELITLIEPDKRAGQKNELSVTLPYSQQLFSVPSNLDIYGTMNTSDHSLTKLDLALRRRFEFIELLPDYALLDDIEVHGVNIGEMLQIMNARIEILLGRDYLIGHSYFLPLKNAENKEPLLAEIFKNKIIPLLQEYFFEDWERIQWVLNDKSKDPKCQFIHLLSDTIVQEYLGNKMKKLGVLFASVNDSTHIPDRRYQINKDAFKEAEAYSKVLAE